MTKRLVIAEKPSVGMSIASVLGVTSRKDGYMEGQDYIVSWGYGHLAELSNADAYDVLKCTLVPLINTSKERV